MIGERFEQHFLKYFGNRTREGDGSVFGNIAGLARFRNWSDEMNFPFTGDAAKRDTHLKKTINI